MGYCNPNEYDADTKEYSSRHEPEKYLALLFNDPVSLHAKTMGGGSTFPMRLDEMIQDKTPRLPVNIGLCDIGTKHGG